MTKWYSKIYWCWPCVTATVFSWSSETAKYYMLTKWVSVISSCWPFDTVNYLGVDHVKQQQFLVDQVKQTQIICWSSDTAIFWLLTKWNSEPSCCCPCVTATFLCLTKWNSHKKYVDHVKHQNSCCWSSETMAIIVLIKWYGEIVAVDHVKSYNYISQKPSKIITIAWHLRYKILPDLPFLPGQKFTGKTVKMNSGKTGKFFYRRGSIYNTTG